MTVPFNPYLQPRDGVGAKYGGGHGYIEVPGKGENLRWQTRAAAPTDYENRLADALVQVFEKGASTAEEIVHGLNEAGHRTASGQRWDIESLTSEMAMLGQ